MKSRKSFYGQIRNEILNMVHCVKYSLKYSWIRRLYNELPNDWKIIPLNYINNALGKNFKFHSNLSIPNQTITSLPSYYKDSWCKYYSYPLEVPTFVSSKF